LNDRLMKKERANNLNNRLKGGSRCPLVYNPSKKDRKAKTLNEAYLMHIGGSNGKLTRKPVLSQCEPKGRKRERWDVGRKSHRYQRDADFGQKKKKPKRRGGGKGRSRGQGNTVGQRGAAIELKGGTGKNQCCPLS